MAELKDDRKIPPEDLTDDAGLYRRLVAASRAIEDKCGQRRFWLDRQVSARIVSASGRRLLRDADGDRLLVDDIGSTDGLLVEVGSAAAGWTEVVDYETEPDSALVKGRPITALLRPRGGWSRLGRQRVRITARWGWPAVPAQVVEASLLLASRLWMRRKSPEGVAGSAEWGTVRVSRWDPDVEALISKYVLE
ncbi:hypothetical protein C1I95_12430 [Micromonospora craterilacus]|uniref:Phage gp6-like head-tail connector protein n=1 Tax=Micromonospora craterilacus TaxID=1655439 RepID=A0A2W2FVY4_9ACTN|nr:hypothetical protein C1I95_12430 [Micromonospora craterilacus]